MVVKIYFYTYVPRFGSSKCFICRNFTRHMKKPDSLDMFYQRISYDIFCPNATIAEFLYSDYLRCPEGSFWKDVERSGKRFSCTSRLRDLYSVADMCEKMYNGALEELSKLFQCDLPPEDYPASHVRVHIRYQYPGMANYIFDQLTSRGIESMSNSVKHENIYDLVMEDADTIGLTCKTLKEVSTLSKVFILPKNEFCNNIIINENIQNYNNRNSLETSTHSLITSICVMIMFIGLISQCCT